MRFPSTSHFLKFRNSQVFCQPIFIFTFSYAIFITEYYCSFCFNLLLFFFYQSESPNRSNYRTRVHIPGVWLFSSFFFPGVNLRFEKADVCRFLEQGILSCGIFRTVRSSTTESETQQGSKLVFFFFGESINMFVNDFFFFIFLVFFFCFC